MNVQLSRRIIAVIGLSIALLDSAIGYAEVVVDFESFSLGGDGVFNGPVPNATTRSGPFGPEEVGTFELDGVSFWNNYNPTFGAWRGFAVSNQTDATTPGFGNQFSALAGSGADGSSQYGVAFGNHDRFETVFGYNPSPFDPTNLNHLRDLPSIYLPAGTSAVGAMVTNTTYAGLSMETGDGFAKQFGGTTGNDADFLRLSVYGVDANDQLLTAEVELFLADYRFSDNSQDYILNQWTSLDLTELAEARSLHFNFESSDFDLTNGMKTPAYFAIDNLTITAVPEPGTLCFLSAIAIGGISVRRRRGRTPRTTVAD